MSEQRPLNLSLAGAIADLRDKLARQDAERTPHRGHQGASLMLSCACCGLKYPKGRWACCAPPEGMKWLAWRALWCQDCPNPNLEEAIPVGKARCPRHCGCERLEGGNLPMPRKTHYTRADVDELRRELVSADPNERTASLPALQEKPAPEPDPEFLKSEWPDG